MLSFVAPWFLLGLLLIPAVIALHFIRRARRVRQVSALWLWGASEAPSQRARFNPNILLLLQILTVLLACFGAAGPLFQSGEREVAVIIDSSAAMSATDVAPSRLEAAKSAAAAVMRGAGRVVLVRAGLSAKLVSASSSDLALRGLEGLVAADSRSDLTGALALVRSVAPNAELHLFTALEPPAGFTGTLHRVLGAGENIGITAFALRGKQVFAAVESNLTAPRTVTVTLERDGKRLLSQALRVPGGSRAIWTPQLTLETGAYRFSIASKDALLLDNEAFAVVSSVRVLVSPAQDDVLKVVVSVPGVRAVVQGVPPSTSAGYDVVMLTGAQPKTLPPGQYVIFAPLPTEREAKTLAPATRVTRSDATDGLLRFASLEGVRVRLSSLAPPLIPDGSWRGIAFAGERAFVWRGDGPGVRAVYIAAHPLESDLRRLPAFPVLIFNILQEFAAPVPLLLGAGLPAGDAVLNGKQTSGIRQALLPGVYEIGRQRFTANLTSSQLTRLNTGASSTAQIGKALETSRSSAIPSSSSSAVWLLALALLALLLEAVLRGEFMARRAI